jgi:hypothetical protein
VNALRREHRLYFQTQRIFLGLLAGYLAIALYRESVPGRDEIYPFSVFSLFSKVPNQCHDFSIRIREIDGRRLSPAVSFENAESYFTSATNHGARMTIQRLGLALERRDAASASREREELESMHLGGHRSLVYEVVARTYDPLDRRRHGIVQSSRVLASYQITHNGNRK